VVEKVKGIYANGRRASLKEEEFKKTPYNAQATLRIRAPFGLNGFTETVIDSLMTIVLWESIALLI
jgi:hypothetical protein